MRGVFKLCIMVVMVFMMFVGMGNAQTNIALHQDPTESDRGWGGGSYPWDIVDGTRVYGDTWAHGLAFCGGAHGYCGQACGMRQATINFGTMQRFNHVLVWHHGDDHIPPVWMVEYWDGAQWHDVGGTSSIRWDMRATNRWSAVPTENIFPEVEGSKVRFRFDNCYVTHGWIYEFEVFNEAPIQPPDLELDFDDGLLPSDHGWQYDSDCTGMTAAENDAYWVNGGVLNLDTGQFGMTGVDAFYQAFGVVEPGDGFVFEARVRVLSVNPAPPQTTQAFVLNVIYGGEMHLLQVGDNEVLSWQGAPVAPVDTSQFHTYTMVKETGVSGYKILVDGVKVLDCVTTSFDPSYNRIYFGDGTCQSRNAHVEIDNVRFCNDLCINTAPIVEAGGDTAVYTSDKPNTVINGMAEDTDPGDVLQYRWLNDETPLKDWAAVNQLGECPLALQAVSLGAGTYTLILEVSDGLHTVTDSMTLTLMNSAPQSSALGGGVYEIGTAVDLGGTVSDYDGDLLTYKWLTGGTLLFEGTIQAAVGGQTVQLPVFTLSDLELGTHSIVLQVEDGINTPVSSSVSVEMVDSTPPVLSPVADKSVLWPPNHKMVGITIQANASDNSGVVHLSAVVSCNEPANGPGDGNTDADWTEPVIDEENGIITLELRAERAGKGNGRVYTIEITATDQSGNSQTANLTVTVPKNNGKK